MSFQTVVEKRELMQDVTIVYRNDLTVSNLQAAQQATLDYVDALTVYAKENPSEDRSVYFSTPSLMTEFVIRGIKRILRGERLNIPGFLRIVSIGDARVTSDGSYRVYAT